MKVAPLGMKVAPLGMKVAPLGMKVAALGMTTAPTIARASRPLALSPARHFVGSRPIV
jgi:hypothetical protein